MSRWIVYSRQGCGLCAEFMSELVELLGNRAVDVEVVDIADDPAMDAKYRHRIPVLTIDGDFVCSFRLDTDRVRRHL